MKHQPRRWSIRTIKTGGTSTRAVLAMLILVATQAEGRAADQISTIENQIRLLQRELRGIKRDMALKDAEVSAAKHEAAQASVAAAQASTAVAQARGATQRDAASSRQAATAAPGVLAASQPRAPIANIVGASSGGAGIGGPIRPPEATKGTVQIGGVTVTLGGFFAGEGVYRTRSESADLATSFAAIPFNQSPLGHESELRESARQSRVSLLAFGDPLPNLRLTGYVEADFLGAAPTANSNESDSYTPRVRQAFAALDYDDRADDVGLHLLGGQAWSLLTVNKAGIVPRQENIPLTIDPQYNVGFTWARQAQLRASADFFDHKFWLAASLENPQTTFSTGGYSTASSYASGANGLTLPLGGFANVNNPGGSLYAPTTNYSEDVAPDIIVKAAADPGFGHYELVGLMRVMRDRTDALGTGHNNTAIGGGGGAAAIIPVVPGLVEMQGSVLAGYGVGRYGSGQLPDATIKPNGDVAPIPEIEALLGVTVHPVKSVDVYGYLGTEQAGRTAYTVAGKGYGYGSTLFVNTGCGTELSTLSCTGNTASLTEATLGYWWRAYQGNYGTMQTGAQYSWVRRDTFRGVGGAPSAIDNLFLLSVRYYPFQ